MGKIKTYEIFSGEDLKIADLIQRRRLQMLIHSCIYYELDANIISDKTWDTWARELKQLQIDYPEISEKVCFYEDFKDWDASTGAFLPIRTPEIIERAKIILHKSSRARTVMDTPAVKPKIKTSTPSGSIRLF